MRKNNAEKLLAAAALAATDVADRLDGYEAIELNRTHAEAVIFYNQEEIIVAFRGTNSLKDWRRNFQFIKTQISPRAYGKAHRGFVKTLNLISEEIFAHLRKLQDPHAHLPRQVWFVGHSLGGAMAQLFAFRYAILFGTDTILGVLCAGAPRCFNLVGSLEYDDLLKEKTVQLINLGDRITTVPPRVFGYRRSGRVLTFVDEDGSTGRLITELSHSIPFLRTATAATRAKLLHSLHRYRIRLRNYPEDKI